MSRSYGDLRGIGFQGSGVEGLEGSQPPSGTSLGPVHSSVGSPGTPQAGASDYPASISSSSGHRPVARTKSRFALLAREPHFKAGAEIAGPKAKNGHVIHGQPELSAATANTPGPTAAETSRAQDMPDHGGQEQGPAGDEKEPNLTTTPVNKGHAQAEITAQGEGLSTAGGEDGMYNLAAYFLEHSDAEVRACIASCSNSHVVQCSTTCIAIIATSLMLATSTLKLMLCGYPHYQGLSCECLVPSAAVLCRSVQGRLLSLCWRVWQLQTGASQGLSRY